MTNSETIIWVLIGISFSTYFIISMVYYKLGINNLQKALITTNGLRLLNLKHFLGIVFFGVLFYITIPELRDLLDTFEIPRLYVLIPLLFVIFLSAHIANFTFKKQHRKDVSVSHYNFSSAWVFFSIRILFLLCYEFFFRGVLLFKFLEYNSVFLAVVYSTLLYIIIHIFDSKKEILGAIPFGVTLCLFTYFTDSIWYAFFIHLTISAVYEVSMFYYQTLKISES